MFHVRHSAKPAQVSEILQLLRGPSVMQLSDLLELGRQRGYEIAHLLSHLRPSMTIQ
jgi:hypothetical protein